MPTTTEAHPLVSVIALCYQHAPFLQQALLSVKKQTYPYVELIIIDDASTDGSQDFLRAWQNQHPQDTVILHRHNYGNCTSFNEALSYAQGKYIIDFATDDLMHPERIAKQVTHLEGLGADWGVSYTDVWLIDEAGNRLKRFYPRHLQGHLSYYPPSGRIYEHIVGKQIISSPSMMIRKEVLTALSGYDATLVYEDYDFWVRSAFLFKYAFLPETLTYKRIVKHSHRSGFYAASNAPYLLSTLAVCQKAYRQNTTPNANCALAQTVAYYLKVAALTAQFDIAMRFYDLLLQLVRPTFQQKGWYWLAKNRINLSALYRWWQQ